MRMVNYITGFVNLTPPFKIESKFKVLGYILKDKLYLHNYYDIKDGIFDVLYKIELEQLPEMYFLSNYALYLMEVAFDHNKELRIFLPVDVEFDFSNSFHLRTERIIQIAENLDRSYSSRLLANDVIYIVSIVVNGEKIKEMEFSLD
jgi:hypothetical protein